MKNLITIKAIKMGLGMGIGVAIFDFFSDGIDWKRSVFIAIFSIIALSVYYKKQNHN